MALFYRIEGADAGAVKHLPGSHVPTAPTDQRCDGCGRWFSNRGISTHRENCEVAADGELRFSRESNRVEVLICKECDQRMPAEALEREKPMSLFTDSHEEGCPFHPAGTHAPSEGVKGGSRKAASEG
jgi:hypothetical protein